MKFLGRWIAIGLESRVRDWLPLIVLAAVVAGGVYLGRPEPPPAEFELLSRVMQEECSRYRGEGDKVLSDRIRILDCENRVCSRWQEVCDRMEHWREARAEEREARLEEDRARAEERD